MSGNRDKRTAPDGCGCDVCTRKREQELAAAARSRAQAAVAAEAGKRLARRHILELGDRAVEVVSSRPGVWHVITDGEPGPVLSPDDISGMLEADREAKARRDRELAGAQHGMTARQADDITAALDQGDREAAAIMLELSEPSGLSAAELERLVPDRVPGTCLSCRLPLSSRDRTEKCAWCLALHNLQARPQSRPAGAGLLSPEEALATWSCGCGCLTQRAHQRRIGVRPAPPRPAMMSVLRPLIACGGCYWASWHWAAPAGFLAALLCFVLFVSFVSRVIRRAAR